MGIEGLEPSQLFELTDFKSVVSTISPYPRTRRHPDLNWRMLDLQSNALPLDYAAVRNHIYIIYIPLF